MPTSRSPDRVADRTSASAATEADRSFLETVAAGRVLGLNGNTWDKGGHAWIPAFERRRDLGSATGCLVFAWFGGTPRWIPGEPTQPPSANRHRSWLEDGRFIREVTSRETLDLNDFTWRYLTK